jgi:hypothetical protein
MWRTGTTAVAVLAMLGVAWTSAADSWNDKTRLTFSTPVMVPGATLPAGTYVFKLADLRANRNLVQIMNADESQVMAVAQAVPMKRMEPKGDVVLKFDPTSPDVAPALRGYYYPGSLYGHEFVYPENQERENAQRTKTIVLSLDTPEDNVDMGVIRTFDAAGQRKDWQGDPNTIREWDNWRRSRPGNAENQQPGANRNANSGVASSSQGANANQTGTSTAHQNEATVHRVGPARMGSNDNTDEIRQATAPMAQTDFQAARVKVDELENNGSKYIGRQVSVTAEVETVLGPRVFTIDEPDWADLEGELLVYVPSNLAALVKENDRVTITGTVKQFVRSDFDREWGWQALSPRVEAQLTRKPVLQASRIVGGDNNVAMIIDVGSGGPNESASNMSSTGDGSAGSNADESRTASRAENSTNKAIGTTGTDSATNRGPIDEISTLADGGRSLIGRHVKLPNARVQSIANGGGFYLQGQNGSVFVLPSHKDVSTLQTGDTVSVTGMVLQMPAHARHDRAQRPQDTNTDIYVLAQSVEKEK